MVGEKEGYKGCKAKGRAGGWYSKNGKGLWIHLLLLLFWYVNSLFIFFSLMWMNAIDVFFFEQN